ncbi:hypothetical protein PHISCL_06993 [Aspergillus sclerotialis]|uniref:Uncharacterized protein n=1 Tax=Aspergillus sclerotialis TaxID=2070753 RepID=A0A3A2ZC12_9EURO|nr:hypothetical protein PHISCL_06993 [Aspergillus sclerotialis]
MEDSKPYKNDPPPPFEEAEAYTYADPDPDDILPPTVLRLTDQYIQAETSPSSSSQRKLLYQIDQPIGTASQGDKKTFTSAKFERVEHHHSPQTAGLDPTSNTRTIDSCQTHDHLFYLVHPAYARYRKDVPAYYITAVSPEMMGNIHFETTKPSRFRKPEFKALLSPKKTMSSSPLFFFKDGKTQTEKCRLLFNAKAKSIWKGARSQYRWADASGSEVALEEEKKLVIIVPMKREIRDFLVGLWVLRLWFDTAESKQARMEALQSMIPPQLYADVRIGKRTGALGALGALGGAAGVGC